MVRKTKRYSRRYARRRSALRASNVFTHKSATSQAYQIRALTKRINNVQRQCRPEVKQWAQSQPYNHTFNNNVLSDAWYLLPFPGPAFNGITQGSGDDQFVGDKIRLIRYQLNLRFLYGLSGQVITTDTGYDGASIRIIQVQCKSNTSVSFNASDILQVEGSSGDKYSSLTLSPLATGLTDRFRVLYDRVITLSSSRPEVVVKIPCRPRNNIVTLMYDHTTTGLDPGVQNQVFTFIFTSGLTYSTAVTETIKMYGLCKLVYTDA